MKKFHNRKLFSLVTLLTVALVFIVFNFGQGQGKALDKPDKPGKPDKPSGKPKVTGTPMDAISEWGVNCRENDPPNLLLDPPNLLLIDTADCGGADVPCGTNKWFMTDFNLKPCMQDSEIMLNGPDGKIELVRGDMSAIRNEGGWIEKIEIWFYDNEGWGYETGIIVIDPVILDCDGFTISVCRDDIPIFPRGHKGYWKGWFVDPVEGLGWISIGVIRYTPKTIIE